MEAVDEVIAYTHLNTWSVSGPDLQKLAHELRGKPGVDQAVAFGNSLHLSGSDPRALEEAIAPYRQGEVRMEADSIRAGRCVHPFDGPHPRTIIRHEISFLQDGFWAMIVKELIQMRRDRMTFAIMFGLPIVQMLLFGFVINSDPRHLPTAVLSGG